MKEEQVKQILAGSLDNHVLVWQSVDDRVILHMDGSYTFEHWEFPYYVEDARVINTEDGDPELKLREGVSVDCLLINAIELLDILANDASGRERALEEHRRNVAGDDTETHPAGVKSHDRPDPTLDRRQVD